MSKAALISGVVALGLTIGLLSTRHLQVGSGEVGPPFAAPEPQTVTRVEQVSNEADNSPAIATPSIPESPSSVRLVPPSSSAHQTVTVESVASVASPYSLQLISTLTNLDLSRGGISPEQAEQWKATYQALVGQGSAAVPAIRGFLARNWELNVDSLPGGDQLGQSSLRSAMLNALGQIGGPEALAVELQTLQATTEPAEVSQLAQMLEQQSPGQYRQQIADSANQLLSMAGSGQFSSDWDVGPLFKVLQQYGDTSALASLEQNQSQWKYYAAIALAGLPDGQGIAALNRQAQQTEGGASRDFALQLLAQDAVQYPDAASALLEQARANQIPDRAWAKIAAQLVGEQIQIGVPPQSADGSASPIAGLKSFHIANGNQNFYSVPILADGQTGQRLAFLDQLAGATASPVALAALQNARATLSAVAAR